eukprot:11179583-Lingulodinium_polyedra.AAC.1
MDALSSALADQRDPEKGISLLLNASREPTLAAINEDALKQGLDYPTCEDPDDFDQDGHLDVYLDDLSGRNLDPAK